MQPAHSVFLRKNLLVGASVIHSQKKINCTKLGDREKGGWALRLHLLSTPCYCIHTNIVQCTTMQFVVTKEPLKALLYLHYPTEKLNIGICILCKMAALADRAGWFSIAHPPINWDNKELGPCLTHIENRLAHFNIKEHQHYFNIKYKLVLAGHFVNL